MNVLENPIPLSTKTMHTVEQLNKLFFVIQCLDGLFITLFLWAPFSGDSKSAPLSKPSKESCIERTWDNCHFIRRDFIRRDLISMVEFVLCSKFLLSPHGLRF